jgi:hypothetical protein
VPIIGVDLPSAPFYQSPTLEEPLRSYICSKETNSKTSILVCIELDDYEILNEFGHNWASKAEKIINLAENIASSKTVFAAMAYTGKRETLVHLENWFEACKSECNKFGYECETISQQNVSDRIIPEMMKRMNQSGFAIIDLTELRPNVFFELGYSYCLRKYIIITAREGTELPFDVRDFPVLFWKADDLRNFRGKLHAKIAAIAEVQGRSASE